MDSCVHVLKRNITPVTLSHVSSTSAKNWVNTLRICTTSGMNTLETSKDVVLTAIDVDLPRVLLFLDIAIKKKKPGHETEDAGRT